MSFLICSGFPKNKMTDCIQFGSCYYFFQSDNNVPSEYYIKKNEKQISIFVGDIFNYSVDNILSMNWEDDIDRIKGIEGEYVLIKYNVLKECVYLYSSKAGIENMYIYKHNDLFIVSNDFWKIIRIINPKFEDIDKDAFIESIYYLYPFDYKTIIKNLFWYSPATFSHYDIESRLYSTNKYWNFMYNNDKVEFDKKIEILNKKFTDAMIMIKKKCGNVKYGVGLSGGLDSRLIPYYAKKANMEIVPFIISKKRPNLLISRDNISSRKIARHFGLKLYEIDTMAENLYEQLNNDVTLYPLGPPALGKLLIKSLPEFDVLITGGNGLIVGSELPLNIDSMSTEELIKFIANHSGRLNKLNLRKERFSRAIYYLFKIKIKNKEMSNINLVSKTQEERMQDKWKDFVVSRKKLGLDNFTIYEEYFSHIIGFRNRLGAFESMGGTKRSFSIYIPFLFEETLTWDKKFLLNRKLLKSTLEKYLPTIYSINSQSYYAYEKNDRIPFYVKITNMIDYLMRGSGTTNFGNIFQRKKIFSSIKKMIYENDSWFYDIISREEVNKILKYKNIEISYLILKRMSLIDRIKKED